MAKEKICGVYCIENLINHKKYIGQSIDIQCRIRKHKEKLRRGNHENIHLQNAWNKYGESNFTFELIQECCADNIDNIEIEYIKKFDSYKNGYNRDLGGNNQAKLISDETRQKIKDNHADFNGSNNPFYGKTHSQDVVNKIVNSEGFKNRMIPIGEVHGMSLLSDEDVFQIKTLLYNKESTVSDLAKKYNVSYECIYNIKSNTRWKHINIDGDYIYEPHNGKKVINISTGEIFDTIRKAAISCGGSPTAIANVCRGASQTSYGYKWAFYYDNKINIDDYDYTLNYIKRGRPVIQYDIYNNKIKDWDSISDAAASCNRSDTAIINNCKGLTKTAGGFVWKYAS